MHIFNKNLEIIKKYYTMWFGTLITYIYLDMLILLLLLLLNFICCCNIDMNKLIDCMLNYAKSNNSISLGK